MNFNKVFLGYHYPISTRVSGVVLLFNTYKAFVSTVVSLKKNHTPVKINT